MVQKKVEDIHRCLFRNRFDDGSLPNNILSTYVVISKILDHPCPEGCGGGVVILKNLISKTFNYVEQNGYLKILIKWVWGKGRRERGLSCPPITFDY
jgi:hypothetical protein